MNTPNSDWKKPWIILAVALGLAVVAYFSAIFGASEWKLRRSHNVRSMPLKIGMTSPDLVEGARLSKIVGCWAGCHGKEGGGGSIDMEGYYSVTAPTLSAVLPLYGDAELVRLIRFGVKRDGTSLLGMTSYTFYPLADRDLANIIGHLRRQPLQPEAPRHRTISLAARIDLAMGKWKVAADQVDPTLPRWGSLPRATSFERGRYLASITCAECHGTNFNGNEFNDNTYDGGPSLSLISVYGKEQFRHLLRTGEPISGRDLGEMSWVAKNGFIYFRDDEIDDIRTFLRAHHGLPKDSTL
ncbi:MAG: cytochrome c [Luteimonas sp.]